MKNFLQLTMKDGFPRSIELAPYGLKKGQRNFTPEVIFK